MQMLIKSDVIAWAKSSRKTRLGKAIDSLPVVQIAGGPDYVTGMSLSRIMNDKSWRQLTADVTSYMFLKK